MSLRNRRSPSGPSAEVQLPIYGANVLVTAVPGFLSVGALGISATATPTDDLQNGAAIPQTGELTEVTIQNVSTTGANAADSVAYEVHLNGVLIVPDPINAPLVTASGSIKNTSQEPLTIPCNVPVLGPTATIAGPPVVPAKHDLVSIKAIPSAAWAGASPVVRVTLKYAPGGPF